MSAKENRPIKDKKDVAKAFIIIYIVSLVISNGFVLFKYGGWFSEPIDMLNPFAVFPLMEYMNSDQFSKDVFDSMGCSMDLRRECRELYPDDWYSEHICYCSKSEECGETCLN